MSSQIPEEETSEFQNSELEMDAPITAPQPPREPENSSEPQVYISPVLSGIDPGDRPNPSPACETCPASVWFITNHLLKCYCSRMHLIVWDTRESPIMQCDGRELALMELQAQKVN